MAFSTLKSIRRPKRGGPCYTYEIEIVAQHATELPLGVGFAGFAWKRKGRLSVADAVPVDGAGGAEWNALCRQTTTLRRDAAGLGWQPKEFIFKVRAFERAGGFKHQHGRTVAKAALDLSAFCMAEPFGPRQVTIPLRPQGLLTFSVRTTWLQHYDREADSYTEISYLSTAPTTATSWLSSGAEEQDLTGFDQLSVQGGPVGQGSSQASPSKRPSQAHSRTSSCSGVGVASSAVQHTQQGHSGLFGGFGAGRTASRRPVGATPLVLGDGGGAAATGAAGGGSGEPTPKLFLGAGGAGAKRAQHAQQHQATPVMGLPEEQWSPIDLDQVRAKLASSDEEGEAREDLSVRWSRRTTRTLRRWLSAPGAADPASAVGTPESEASALTKETSVTELRRRCRQLLTERDEARADGYAAQSEALQRAVELDNMARTKAALAERLAYTEEQLMAKCKDEGSLALLAALAEAKVAAAEKDFQVMELQGEVRKYKAEVESLRAQLTRLEAHHRASVHSSRTPDKGLLGEQRGEERDGGSPFVISALRGALPRPPEAAVAAAAKPCGRAAAADSWGGGVDVDSEPRGSGDGQRPENEWSSSLCSGLSSETVEVRPLPEEEGEEGVCEVGAGRGAAEAAAAAATRGGSARHRGLGLIWAA